MTGGKNCIWFRPTLRQWSNAVRWQVKQNSPKYLKKLNLRLLRKSLTLSVCTLQPINLVRAFNKSHIFSPWQTGTPCLHQCCFSFLSQIHQIFTLCWITWGQLKKKVTVTLDMTKEEFTCWLHSNSQTVLSAKEFYFSELNRNESPLFNKCLHSHWYCVKCFLARIYCTLHVYAGLLQPYQETAFQVSLHWIAFASKRRWMPWKVRHRQLKLQRL